MVRAEQVYVAVSAEGLPLPAVAAHYGWLARQYHTAAEMIAGAHLDKATLQVGAPQPGALALQAHNCKTSGLEGPT